MGILNRNTSLKNLPLVSIVREAMRDYDATYGFTEEEISKIKEGHIDEFQVHKKIEDVEKVSCVRTFVDVDGNDIQCKCSLLNDSDNDRLFSSILLNSKEVFVGLVTVDGDIKMTDGKHYENEDIHRATAYILGDEDRKIMYIDT